MPVEKRHTESRPSFWPHQAVKRRGGIHLAGKGRTWQHWVQGKHINNVQSDGQIWYSREVHQSGGAQSYYFIPRLHQLSKIRLLGKSKSTHDCEAQYYIHHYYLIIVHIAHSLGLLQSETEENKFS